MSQGSDVVATLGYGMKSSWGFNKNCESLESVNQNMKDAFFYHPNQKSESDILILYSKAVRMKKGT